MCVELIILIPCVEFEFCTRNNRLNHCPATPIPLFETCIGLVEIILIPL